MTAEPATEFAKKAAEIVKTIWDYSALLLWCLATVCFVVLAASYTGAYFHFGQFEPWRDESQSALVLAGLVFCVFAGFRTFADRKPSSLALVPLDKECIWGRAQQPDGAIISQINIHFQVTNMADSPVMLSGIRLARPWVSRRSVITDMLITKHPTQNEYSSKYPIAPHSLTYGSATIIVDHPIGRLGRPMRVVVRLRDQRGSWHKLVCPHVTPMPYQDKARPPAPPRGYRSFLWFGRSRRS